MRLRYLHIRKCPPLEDVAVTFGEQTILDQACAIHFVVGVNGSGKTRLLRALAEIFLCLEQQRMPPFPCTVVYDLYNEPQLCTLVFDYPGGGASEALLLDYRSGTCRHWGLSVPDDQNLAEKAAGGAGPDMLFLEGVDWAELVRCVRADKPYRHAKPRRTYTGDDLPGSGDINRLLPRTLLAYTSGAPEPWFATFRSATVADSASLDQAKLSPEDERPRDWDDSREVVRNAEVAQSPPRVIEPPDESASKVTPSVGFFVSGDELRLAASVMTVAHAFAEFAEYPTEADRRAFVQRIRESRQRGERLPGLRGILNEVDWLWPLSLTLDVDWCPKRLDPEQRETARQLAAIARSVQRQPGGGSARRFHIDLSRAPDLSAAEQTRAEKHPVLIAQFLRREPCCVLEVFEKLCAWHRSGFLQGIDLIVHKLDADDLLLYDQLSDGEQEFLGRICLFRLLDSRKTDGQDGAHDALILLDEPETHFNDVWKRELVAIIGDVIGNRANQVLISTHSSIALTDVFDEEITLLRKGEGGITVVPIAISTFGADPGEIMIHVFGAKETIGKRSLEWLDKKLDEARHWGAEHAEELRRIIRQIGPGYHRSEFRAILKRLTDNAT